MSERRLEEFARRIEARDPEAYARVLDRLQELQPVDSRRARTLAAIIVAMDMDGHIDADLLEPSQ